jgi:hypothetical protein
MNRKFLSVLGGTTDNIPCRSERQEPPRDIRKTIWFFDFVILSEAKDLTAVSIAQSQIAQS